jgi:hypothetical protein
MRKLIWLGILTPLAILCLMNSACGGYLGWPGLSTGGGDAKGTIELSVGSSNPLQSGLWTVYVNYNNISGQGMKTVSTYHDNTAPFAVFTSDGLGQQHFNDHVGVLAATAYDRDGDGRICWIGCPFGSDYTIPNAFCQLTADSNASDGFSAYCNKSVWSILIATNMGSETKQSVPGSKFSNAQGGGSNFSPITLGQILATSTPIAGSSGGITVTLNGLSLPNGASHALAAPASVSAFGFGNGLALNADQPGLKDAAAWLASQWTGQPDGFTNVTLSLNGGAASGTISIASGNSAAVALQNYAAQ